MPARAISICSMGHNSSIALAAGTGAALLRPRCRYGRCAAAALHIVVPRSTCNVQPSPPSHLAPHPLAPRATSPRAASPRATAPLRPSTLSSHVQRATFNLQLLAPRALRGPRCQSRRSSAAPLHVVVPRSTCNVQPATPRASSPRTSCLAPHAPRPYTPNNASFCELLHTSLRLSANCHLRGILQSAFRSGFISGFVAIDVIGVHPQNRRAPIAIRLE